MNFQWYSGQGIIARDAESLKLETAYISFFTLHMCTLVVFVGVHVIVNPLLVNAVGIFLNELMSLVSTIVTGNGLYL
jgi:hypothetical protein